MCRKLDEHTSVTVSYFSSSLPVASYCESYGVWWCSREISTSSYLSSGSDQEGATDSKLELVALFFGYDIAGSEDADLSVNRYNALSYVLVVVACTIAFEFMAQHSVSSPLTSSYHVRRERTK
jgi:hypothetical protein